MKERKESEFQPPVSRSEQLTQRKGNRLEERGEVHRKEAESPRVIINSFEW